MKNLIDVTGTIIAVAAVLGTIYLAAYALVLSERLKLDRLNTTIIEKTSARITPGRCA